MQEVPHHVEDGTIADCEAVLDGLVAKGLNQVTFTGPGRA
jgi:hypothetical protein